MTKDSKTGIVSYNKEACIGCRYCQVACPFIVPTFEWDNPFPEIVKCQLCSHLVAKGELPGCCNACPTGASLFGPVTALLEDAKRRVNMHSGKYIPYIYGENEVGGTQVFMLTGVPFGKLGLPDLPSGSYVALAENIQHTLYKGMMLPIATLVGLIFLIKRADGNKE